MRILITGGTGFIGTALAERLRSRGGRLVLFSRHAPPRDALRQDDEHVAGAVTDGAAVEKAARSCDWLFHLAAREDLMLRDDPFGDAMFAVNVLGTRAVLAAAGGAGVRRVVVVTSFSTFGYAGDAVPNDGTTPLNVNRLDSVYVWSRVQQERECLEAAALGQDVVVCAPAGIVGPGDRKGTAGLLHAFARGRVPAVPPGGFNWMSIDDVADGLVAAAERGRRGRRYLFAHENLTYRELLARAGALIGRDSPPVLVPRALLSSVRAAGELLGPWFGLRPGVAGWDRILCERWYASARIAIDEIGLRQTPIDDSLRRTLEAVS